MFTLTGVESTSRKFDLFSSSPDAKIQDYIKGMKGKLQRSGVLIGEHDSAV